MNLETWIASDHATIATRFEAAIAAHVPIEMWNQTPPGGGSCIAGLLFHMTLHEDLAINTAVRNEAPIIDQHRQLLGIDHLAKSTGLSETEDPRLIEALNVDQLRLYVEAVTTATAQWLSTLDTNILDTVPDASPRLEHTGGIAVEGLEWLHSMWAGKPTTWFVQWEAIGHRHGHLGEMVGIRGRLGRSPF